jgi:DAK2 domain
MESTKTMASLAGRSNYVDQQRMNGIPDPGAAVVAEAFETAANIGH